MRTEHVLCSLGLLAGFVVGSGCWGLAEAHCGNLAGDQTCAERGIGAFCDTCRVDGDGCTDARPADDCYFAGPGEESSTSGGSTTTSSDGGLTADETTLEPSSESGVTTGPPSCLSDEECEDAAAPFCGASGECVTCDGTVDPDGACAGSDPAFPVCVNGGCVQCTAAASDACSGTTPVCDEVTNVCVCTEHDQCGEAACNFFTGACLPADAVVHVGSEQDFGTLTAAVASFVKGTEGTIIVHQGNYLGSVTVDGDRVLAFLAADGTLPTWTTNLDSGSLLTADTSTVLLDGLTLTTSQNFNPAMLVTNGRAWVDRSRLVDNVGASILAQAGAELVLRNSFVGGNSDRTNALEVVQSSVTVLHATLAAGLGSGAALWCSKPTGVVVRNSLIVSRGPESEVDCSGVDVSHTATEMLLNGRGNVALGTMTSTEWFNAFGMGDFHLSGLHPEEIATTARWMAGDPRTDIDGDPRPNVDGAADYAGADVP